MPARTYSREALLKAAMERVERSAIEQLRKQEQPIPKGWYSTEELASHLKCDTYTVRRRMRLAGVARKKIKRVVGTILRGIYYYNP